MEASLIERYELQQLPPPLAVHVQTLSELKIMGLLRFLPDDYEFTIGDIIPHYYHAA